MIVKIKICGLTNLEDAKAAVDLGADMLGFNFYKDSPRFIEPAKAVRIICKLPAFIDTVGVFVNPKLNDIKPLVADGLLNWVQLHGDETPAFCESLTSLAVRTIKAIRVKGPDAIELAESYPVDAILLDAYDQAKYGGTGTKFDWGIIGDSGRRIIVAGGITPDNVMKAVELGVYGIDVCSGVEERPGKKDLKKMKKLFETVRYIKA
jgi:phosphoribosylanthranilate isomerase